MSWTNPYDYRAQLILDLFRYCPLPLLPLVILLDLVEQREGNALLYAFVITLAGASLVLELHPRVRAFRQSYFA